ncbi:FAD-binding protein [Patescibacteria group bacterium]|nr:FAD-binding protein [Patescibacteria group bacterium]
MIIKNDEDLSTHTSFKIGGTAKVFYIPENRDELINLIKTMVANKTPFNVLGNGSNLLVEDKAVFCQPIILNKGALDYIKVCGSFVEAGSATDLRNFISKCVDANLKAFPELIGIPASIGGAIYMNAGIGSNKSCISDSLIEVEVFDGSSIFILKKYQCDFGYRSSVFQRNKKFVILSAKFGFQFQGKEVGHEIIKFRLASIGERSYFKHKSAGSIFSKHYSPILKLLRGVRLGGASFSKSDTNIILNLNHASYNDVRRLIVFARFLHF